MRIGPISPFGFFGIFVFVFCLTWQSMYLGQALAQEAPVVVSDAWAPATESTTGFVYMTIRNLKAEDLKINDAVSPIGQAETYERSPDGRDLPVDYFLLEGGKTLELSADGSHISIFHLKSPLRQGMQFPLKLSFFNFAMPSVTVQVTVR
jgi:copper(I)-binding protein